MLAVHRGRRQRRPTRTEELGRSQFLYLADSGYCTDAALATVDPAASTPGTVQAFVAGSEYSSLIPRNGVLAVA
jgi:hypothetical protein